LGWGEGGGGGASGRRWSKGRTLHLDEKRNASMPSLKRGGGGGGERERERERERGRARR
jgi:hypothetical protein